MKRKNERTRNKRNAINDSCGECMKIRKQNKTKEKEDKRIAVFPTAMFISSHIFHTPET
jgi:hypothetical protein